MMVAILIDRHLQSVANYLILSLGIKSTFNLIHVILSLTGVAKKGDYCLTG